MRWHWRTPRFWLKSALIFVGVIFLFVVFLFATTPGARLVISLALKRVPGEISIAKIEGRLAGRLSLHELQLVTPSATIEVGLLQVNWLPNQLLAKRLHIQRLWVEDVSVRMQPTPSDTTTPNSSSPLSPITPPKLPFTIIVDTAHIAQVHMLLEGGLEVSNLRLTIHGRPEDYQLQLASHLAAKYAPAADLTLQAHGDLSELAIDPLELRTGKGTITAQAHAAWYPQINWQARLRADSLAVGQFTTKPEQWPGILNTALSTEGHLDKMGTPVGWATLDSLGGTMRDEAVSGHGRIESSGLANSNLTLNLRWANFLTDLTATLSDSINAKLRVTCPDLASLPIRGTGSIELNANVHGPLRTPQGTATLRADSLLLSAQKLAASRVAAKLAFDLADEGKGSIESKILGLDAGGAAVDTLRLRAQGTRAHQRAHLDFSRPNLRGVVALAGSLTPDSLSWSGSVDTLELANPQLGVWQLERPVRVMAGRTAASLDSLRLVQDDAALALGGNWQASGWSAAGTLDSVPLELVNAWLPAERSLHGFIEANFRAKGTAEGDVDAKLSAGLTDTRLRFVVADTPDSLTFANARLQAAMGDSGLTATLGLSVHGARTDARVAVKGDLSLPQYSNLKMDARAQRLTASLRADLPDLGVFEGLDPHATGLGGKLTLSAEASGTVGKPKLQGELRATGLTMTAPDFGITVREGELIATGNPEQGFTLKGGAHSGEGEIHIEGKLPASPSSGTPVELSVAGDRFQLMSTPEIEALVSPDLKLRYDSQRLDVKGKVALPKLHVELVEVPETAVRPSRDVIIVGEKEEPKAPPVNTWVELQVVLGDDVSFKGYGATATLEGSVQLKEHAPKPPEVHGDIRIRKGNYRAYGQNLTLDEGTISFVGPAQNPNLRMRAYRTAPDGVITGVMISGTAEQPELRVYSQPSMPDVDAISYLVTGHAPQSGSGGRQVAGAAALLGSNVLSSAVGSKIGLDEAQIETGGSLNEAALVAGKYITPDLFLSYAMGLFDRTNLVRLRYILSRNWAVQTETGSTQGADVFYKFERGGPKQ